MESWDVDPPPLHIGIEDNEPGVYFRFCEAGFDHFCLKFLWSCLEISVVGRRPGSETVTPTEVACINNLD